MKIQRFTRLSVVVSLAFLGVMTVLVLMEMHEQQIRYRQAQQHTHISELANKFNKSIVTTVSLARDYVATGDPDYKKRYFKALEIREGARDPSAPRASNAGQSQAAAAVGARVDSLLALMKSAGFSIAGLQIMKDVERYAARLSGIDQAAFAALEDRQGTQKSAGDSCPKGAHASASELLYSPRYQQLLLAASLPIVDFTAAQNHEINAELLRITTAQKHWQHLFEVVILLGICLMLVATRYARRRILQPLDQLNRQASAIAKGDYSSRCDIRATNEIGQLGRTFNIMAEAIELDIRTLKVKEEIIWQQANIDSLTGLPNRKMLLDRLAQQIKKAQRSGKLMALMFVDLDHFKEVNDTLGHNLGDLLLKEAAQRLSSCVRGSDMIARLGGDEFTVILDDLGAPWAAERIARDIVRTMSIPFKLGDEIAYVSASVGITVYPYDGENPETLLKSADQAMYDAKSQGRNRYSYFTPSMQEAAQTRHRLVKDLRNGISEEQFCIFYQPIVRMSDGLIRKAEALLRWRHPVRGLIAPGEFITIAEETGMINELGDWCFREAARQAAMWRSAGRPDIQVSINTSPIQYRNKAIDLESWMDHLNRVGLRPANIIVEITEGMLMEATTGSTDVLLGYRDAGIAISLDDFGTGYSSLSYLTRFNVDYLKIDKTFVRNIRPGSEDLLLCEAIIEMAHCLRLMVVAEGIETAEQHELLRERGCDFGQGFLYSRPVPAAEFERFLAAPFDIRNKSSH